MVITNFLVYCPIKTNKSLFRCEQKHTVLKIDGQCLSHTFEVYHKISNKNKKLYLISEHTYFRNSYTNIISKQTANIIYKKHIFDSLTLISIFRCFWSNTDTKKCVDFGAGGGFPGLIISIFFPEIFITLLDSIERKINFHLGAFKILEGKNCNSICLRGEHFIHSSMHRKKYDVITSRAVAKLVDSLKLFLNLSKSKGKIFAMKKLKGCAKEINETSIYFSTAKFKLKCLMKIDKRNSGKILIIYMNK